MKDGTTRFYEFGEFRLDARKRLLLKNGTQTQISPRIFDLLLVLVQNDGEILGHDELLDKVWDGMFVEQSNLKKSVSALRQILGEHPDERLYVRTIPRRGYSFVAPVRVIGDGPEAGPVYLRETHTEIVVEEIEESDDLVLGVENPNRLVAAPNNVLHTIKSHKIAVAIAFTAIIAVAVYGIWALRTKDKSQFGFENIKITRLTTLGDLNGVVLSPDGKYFLYANLNDGGASLWLQQTITGIAKQMTLKMPASFYSYGFSADGNYINYTVNNNPDASQNGFFRTSLLGGPPQRMPVNTTNVSPDGSRIVFSETADGTLRVFTATVDGLDQKQIAAFGGEYRLWSGNWSPDSKFVLLALRRIAADKTIHYVAEYPVDGGNEKIIMPEMEKQITNALWLPDKNSLLLCLREVNAETRQIWQYFPASGALRRVTNDTSSYFSLSMSRDGRSIAATASNRLLSIWTSENEKFDFKQTTSGVSNIGKASWLADGKIVYSEVSNGAEAIYVINSDGKDKKQITKGDDGIRLNPRVSSDGRTILFNSSRSGYRQLWRVDTVGGNLAYLTNVNDIQIFDGKVLGDNKTVIFDGDARDKAAVLFLGTPDGKIKMVTDFSVSAWDISPDERFIAYVAPDKVDGRKRIFIRGLDGGEPLRSFDVPVGGEIRWTRDGRGLTYAATIDDAGKLFLQSIDGGTPRLLANFPGERIFSFDWSFEGKRLAVVRGKLVTDAVMITPGQ